VREINKFMYYVRLAKKSRNRRLWERWKPEISKQKRKKRELKLEKTETKKRKQGKSLFVNNPDKL